jgi:outer membrane autotransporter protein
LQPGQTAAAFDQLSGEVHASTVSTIVTNAGMSRAAVNNRIRDSFSGGGVNSAPLVASNEDNMDGLLGKEKTTQAWMSNFGSWSRTSGGSHAHDTTTRGGGFMIGVDTQVLDDWRFGVATGFGRDSIQDKNVSSSAMVDSYYLAAYGGTEIQATSLRFGALHAFQKIDAKRSVAFTGFTDNLTSDYDAQTTQLFAEGALRIKHQESRFEPYLNLAVVHSKVDGFQEKGGAAALTSSSQTDNQLFSTLGLRFGHDLEIDAWGLSGELKAGLGWRHAYGDMSQDATVSFSGSDSFTVSSAADSRDSAVLEAGVGVDVAQDTTVSLNYNGDFSKDTRENTLSAKLAVKF